MTLRPCLTCGALSPGSRCPSHNSGTSWNGTRDRAAQQRFRDALLERAGHQCEYVVAGQRCPVTRDLQAHHTQPGNPDPSLGRLLCRTHHRAVDRHAR